MDEVSAADVLASRSEFPEIDNEDAKYLEESDLGNGLRFVAYYGHRVRYVRGVGWHVLIDGILHHDEGAVRKLAQQTARRIVAEASALPRDDDKTRRFKHGIKSQKSAHITAMLTEAAPHLSIDVQDLDADPYLLAVGNGVVDLRTGEVRERSLDDLLTKSSPVDFNPRAEAPEWRAFLDRILPDRDEQHFLLKWCGYCLTGDVSEQCLVFLHGSGANGKSTFLEILRRIMGGYAVGLPIGTLMHDNSKRGGEASPDLARLPGARMAVAAEPDTGSRFSESILKQMTGGDTIITRRLHREFFEFRPSFKLCIHGNQRPAVRGQDEGIWRRLLLVPFTEFIPPEERDKHLTDKLWSEREGILAWLIEGTRLWLHEGLAPPAAVRAATQRYRSAEDPLGDFIGDVVTAFDGATVSAADLFRAYTMWARSNGRDPVTQQLFGRMMGERGFERRKSGVYYWAGLALTDEWLEKVQEESQGKSDG